MSHLGLADRNDNLPAPGLPVLMNSADVFTCEISTSNAEAEHNSTVAKRARTLSSRQPALATVESLSIDNNSTPDITYKVAKTKAQRIEAKAQRKQQYREGRQHLFGTTQRQRAWIESRNKSRIDPIVKTQRAYLEKAWARQRDALCVKRGLPTNRRSRRAMSKALRRQIKSGVLPSPWQLWHDRNRESDEVDTPLSVNALEKGIGQKYALQPTDTEAIEFLHLMTCPPFDYGALLATTPVTPPNRDWKQLYLTRLRGITTQDSRVWHWHRETFDRRGIGKNQFRMEVVRFHRRRHQARMEAGSPQNRIQVLSPREELERRQEQTAFLDRMKDSHENLSGSSSSTSTSARDKGDGQDVPGLVCYNGTQVYQNLRPLGEDSCEYSGVNCICRSCQPHDDWTDLVHDEPEELAEVCDINTPEMGQDLGSALRHTSSDMVPKSGTAAEWDDAISIADSEDEKRYETALLKSKETGETNHAVTDRSKLCRKRRGEPMPLGGDRHEEEEEYSFNQIGFPVLRRPDEFRRSLRTMTAQLDEKVDEMLAAYPDLIGLMAETEEQRRRARQLLATWHDLFTDSVYDLQETDLVVH